MVSYKDVIATVHHGRMDSDWSIMPCVKGNLPDEIWIERSMMDPDDVNIIDNAIMCSEDMKHGDGMRAPGFKVFDHISNYGRTFDNEDGDIDHGYSIWDPKDLYPLSKEDIELMRTVFFKYFKPDEWAARKPNEIVKPKNRRVVDFRADNLVLGPPNAPKIGKKSKTGPHIKGKMTFPEKFKDKEWYDNDHPFKNIRDAFRSVVLRAPGAKYSVVAKAVKTNGSAYGFSFAKNNI
jgi:hypothetical protein